MLWPIVLPFKITLGLLAAIVVLLTALASALKWKRGKVFGVASLVACLAFVPSCTGIMAIVDSQRFGTFQCENFADVNDFRIERYLPTQARDITLNKCAQGHQATYSISESDLRDYLDGQWDRYGQDSASSREELNDGSRVSADAYDFQFDYDDLGWPAFDAVRFHSPVEEDGGGAIYYFDPATGTAYHRAGYW